MKNILLKSSRIATCMRSTIPLATKGKLTPLVASQWMTSGQLRYYSTPNPENNPSNNEDMELQKSFDGFMPRFHYLLKLPFDEKEIENATKLMQAELVPTLYDAVSLYADLQNPLLKKYQFDPKDFLIGAKDAITKVWTAAASQEFFEYCSGVRDKSEEGEFIKESVNPTVYNNFIFVNKQLKMGGLEHLVIKSFKFNEFKISSIETDIYEEYGESKKSGNLGEVMLKTLHKDIEHLLSKESPEDWKLKAIPLNCVICHVTVEYNATEMTEITMKDKESSARSMDTKGQVRFVGCLSGQHELDWRIFSYAVRS